MITDIGCLKAYTDGYTSSSYHVDTVLISSSVSIKEEITCGTNEMLQLGVLGPFFVNSSIVLAVLENWVMNNSMPWSVTNIISECAQISVHSII